MSFILLVGVVLLVTSFVQVAHGGVMVMLVGKEGSIDFFCE